MADNTLNIGISAQIDGLKKGLDDAKKELGGFTDGQEKAFKQAGDSSKQLTGGIQKSSKAIQEADNTQTV